MIFQWNLLIQVINHINKLSWFLSIEFDVNQTVEVHHNALTNVMGNRPPTWLCLNIIYSGSEWKLL